MANYTGSCLCGAITAEIIAEPKWVGNCHCPSCRRVSGAAFATYAGFDAAAVKFSGDTPNTHKSSPGAIRHFCNECGSSIAFEGEAWPEEIHLHIGFIKEADSLKPETHVYTKTKLEWLHIDEDGLPKFDKFSDQ
ncbi:GFA family protein [Kordiimonas sp. SCSIO 12610]|uniref:GFA family protein n=1 Tax=Kordiimonas sp. SCSIO 12610 TaxID=2829597 RepID=UPI00210B65E0|nr:GFA family protein [Kordiimonas sp. SCSIO 12610]UTW54479.1 GFA family protein [Kordiimonas sp. SCSIO 12610]